MSSLQSPKQGQKGHCVDCCTFRCGARATGLAYARRACGHGDIGIGPHQIVAATLTLFQPEGAD